MLCLKKSHDTTVAAVKSQGAAHEAAVTLKCSTGQHCQKHKTTPLHKHGGLSLDPQHPCIQPGVAVCVYNPSTG